MTGSRRGESTSHRSRVQFAELLKVQGKLALREPIALLGGIGLPVILLLVFGFIGQQVPGNVGSTGLTIIDLWTPTILVIAFIFISVSLPNTLVRDREIGWLRRVSTTPLHPSRLLAAQLIIDLILAAAAVLIVLLGGALLFGASLHMEILPFGVSLLLSIAEIFALGLVLVALVPSQAVASAAGGVMAFGLMFLSGLWVNPAQVGDPLRTIMYYSPSGAATRAVLDSAFNGGPSYAALLTTAVYTVIFGFIAVRYFRWE
ncbi:MAG TPA: ABC transporter permease [Candidatus Dormibacteraeota bacterium]|nr:ABC transporter permease [Candidatus Dormibacteraeota bacterium]